MNRQEILERFSPVFDAIDYRAPLQVGNGEIAMGVDVTGFQTLNQEYTERHVPLCTMAQWGWHTKPPVSQEGKTYTLSDLTQTEYEFNGRTVHYPVEKTSDNAAVYDWLRENPHRANLMEISLRYNDEIIQGNHIYNISQKLDLFSGNITSQYQIEKDDFLVETRCDSISDTFVFTATSDAFINGNAKLQLHFPYASHLECGMQEKSGGHYHTSLIINQDNLKIFECRMDEDSYYVKVSGNDFQIVESKPHNWFIIFKQQTNNLCIEFTKEKPKAKVHSYEIIQQRSNCYWRQFWLTVGFVDFTKSKHPKALELQRRILLSQYLLAIQSAGSIPPQETGLLSNSWYGKFHLEMHLWHSAYMPLWNRPQDLQKSLPWYLRQQTEAKQNATKNKFQGIRWPKMIGPEGIDSPSPIATLLIWQQSHIIYLLELVYQRTHEQDLLIEYWPLVKETVIFMIDFLVLNENTGGYEMLPPIFPSQESFDPTTVVNPTFEIEYWRFCLKIACQWAKRMGEPYENWLDVYHHIASSRIHDGCYVSHENCPETFEEYAIDHPTMLGIYGLIANDRIDLEALSRTLEKVLEVWEYDTLWGWDYGMMAMTATRLGKPELALDILLSDTSKNNYQKNGHNLQSFRNDLPAYLPGNGSLLLAIGLMVAGYPGAEQLPGIPKNGQWHVEYENITAFPY